MENQEKSNKMGQVITKAWSDEGFKQRLMANPKSVLEENGMNIPGELEVKVLENTDKVFHLVLPPKPKEEKSLISDLEQVEDGIARGCCDVWIIG